MIALDTNVLIRYIVQDDAIHAKKATRLLETRCTRDMPGLIDGIVLCELVWVLESAYGYSRDVVASVIRQLLGTAELLIAESEYAWAALRAYEKKSGDFADYLLSIRNSAAGAATTCTFDKKAVAGAPDLFTLVK